MSVLEYHTAEDLDIEARMVHGRLWFERCRAMSNDELERAILIRVGAWPGSLTWGEREVAMLVLNHRPKAVWS